MTIAAVTGGAPARRRRLGLAALAVLVVVAACGSDAPPPTLEIDVGGSSAVVAKAAGFMEGCYRDGSEPETCTTAGVAGLYDFCADLVGATELTTEDGVGAVTTYPADNPRIGEASCLFTNPRSSLSIELWRDPPTTLCAPDSGLEGTCARVGDRLEVGRRADLPSISVAGQSGAVVSTVASPTLDEDQLLAAAAVLAALVFDEVVTPDDLAAAQSASSNPE